MNNKSMLLGWLLSGALFFGGSVVLYFTWNNVDSGSSAKAAKHDEHKGHDHGDSGKKHADHDEHKGHDHGGSGKKHGGHDDHGNGQEVKLSSGALKRVTIKSVRVIETKAAAHQISAVGRVALPPKAVSRVGSRVEGRIVRWFVKLGQRIKRGHRLALLDSPAVGRARAAFLKAHALERLVHIEHKRTKRLKRSGLASSKQLLAARVAHQKAKINLRMARAQLRILGVSEPSKNQLKRLSGLFVLRAPSSGEITEMPTTLGAWVNPQTTILRIEDRSKIWVLLEIYSRDFPYIRVGQKAHLYGPGVHKHLEGTIQYLSSRFERGAQTIEARVVLPNPGGRIRPNQFLYAKIQSNLQTKTSKSNAKSLLIPESAIQRIGQRQIVFVMGKKPGHYKVRTVVTIEAPGGYAKVLYGLKHGERIVSKGTFVLKSELQRKALEEAGHGHSH